MAPGAEARERRRMMVARGRVTLIGVGIGVVAAVLATRLLETLLFGGSAIDLTAFAAVSAIMRAAAAHPRPGRSGRGGSADLIIPR